ncbi:hypothetical protein GWN63_03980 [Candidatus Bathyarchaeota archaeon]|nr:isoprenylcysteine carboxylmethyltransferase family protein [Candidatus Bathyarchaeota archaeon]NIU81389.1 hypothetical protein [Candidatus Bathyarchaeota archaeon]NIV68015.1 hypothetical protein [Candidatus Bathyarchaeota archaeon]NIW34552.1 hypothetical protein [Candidatus Bathyarchaeota archaeon]
MEEIIAVFLFCCLSFHLAVNLWNLTRRGVEGGSEAEHQQKPQFVLAAFGTILFWVESFLYPVLVFSGLYSWSDVFPLQLHFMGDYGVQVLGMILSGAGYLLFWWSVMVRGRFAVAWSMKKDHRLVTWGPYALVRHPSYVAYFLLFFGLLFMWLNLLVVPCLVAIPGYFQVVEAEERMLVERFGEEYKEYKRRVGRFLPQPAKG